MLRLPFDAAAGVADLERSGGNLATDDGLEAACVVSLFTDRRAEDGPVSDRRGWWGDAYLERPIGSRVWQLARVAVAERPARAKEFVEEALAWLVEDGIAGSVNVTAAAVGTAVQVTVEIVRPRAVAPAFKRTWEVVSDAV